LQNKLKNQLKNRTPDNRLIIGDEREAAQNRY